MISLDNLIGKVYENADHIQIEIIDIVGEKAIWKFVGETKKHKTQIYFDGNDYYISVINTRIYLR